MPNIIDILARALSLRQETALNSITPNRAGGIMYDTLLVLNQMQLEGGSLLISKVYASVSAMEADTTPTSDLTGRALKPGQLVVIVTSDSSSSDMGSEYRFNGPGSWTYVGKVGGLPLDTVPTQSSTKGITSGGVYTALAAMKAEGYKYMGLATPGSGGTAPGTPNQPVFYIAGPGSYPNFGSITVASGYLGFIKYSGGSWSVESVAVGKDYDEEISQLDAKVDELEEKTGGAEELVPGQFIDNYFIRISGEIGQLVNPASYDCALAVFDVEGKVGKVELSTRPNTQMTGLLWGLSNQVANAVVCPVYGSAIVSSPQEAVVLLEGDYKYLIVACLESHEDVSVTLNEDRIGGVEKTVEGLKTDVEGLKTDVEGLKTDVEGLEGGTETTYENVGQIGYYKQLGTSNAYIGICCYTPIFPNGCSFNRLVMPPFKSASGDKDIKYFIGYGVWSSQGLVPSTALTKVKEGVIASVPSTFVENYEIELDEVVEVPANMGIFVFLMAQSGKTEIVGGGASETENLPFSVSDQVQITKSSGITYDSPFTVTWYRANADTTARYRVCSPILRLVIEGKLDEIEEEIEQANDRIDNLEQMIDDEVKVVLPEKIYAVVGDTLQLFYRGIVLAPNPYAYDIRVMCEKGSRYARYFQYLPTANDIGTTSFTIDVLDRNGKSLGTATAQLVTVASPSSPATDKKIVCLGDSLTSGGVWPAEANRRLTGTGGTPSGNALSNLSFCGSLMNGNTGYFGAGGWTWHSYLVKGSNAFRFQVSGATSIPFRSVYENNGHQYTVQEVNITGGEGNILCSVSSASDVPTPSGVLTRVSGGGDATITFSQVEADSQNPLWDMDNNKMTFVPYANEYCGGTIDAVYILLTWNGITPFMNAFASILADVKTFADTLHSEFPNAKLKIVGIQMPNQKDTHGYGANGGYSDMYGMTYTAMMLNEAYREFANREDYASWVEYVGTAPQFDSEYNMQVTDKAVNTRNAETEVVGNNGVHPANSGYMQIADAVYRNIVAEFCQS